MIRSGVGRLAVAAVAVLLGGCSSGSCTLIGCGSSVVVDVSQASGALGTAPAILTLCVEDACQDTAWPLAAGETFVMKQQDEVAPRSHPTSVRLSARPAAGGAQTFSAQTAVELTKFAPNGESCGPVCWSAELRLVSGQLLPA